MQKPLRQQVETLWFQYLSLCWFPISEHLCALLSLEILPAKVDEEEEEVVVGGGFCCSTFGCGGSATPLPPVVRPLLLPASSTSSSSSSLESLMRITRLRLAFAPSLCPGGAAAAALVRALCRKTRRLVAYCLLPSTYEFSGRSTESSASSSLLSPCSSSSSLPTTKLSSAYVSSISGTWSQTSGTWTLSLIYIV